MWDLLEELFAVVMTPGGGSDIKRAPSDIIKLVIKLYQLMVGIFHNPDKYIWKLASRLNMYLVMCLAVGLSIANTLDARYKLNHGNFGMYDDLSRINADAEFDIIIVICSTFVVGIIGALFGSILGLILGKLVGSKLESESKVHIISHIVLAIFIVVLPVYVSGFASTFIQITNYMPELYHLVIAVISFFIPPVPLIICISFILDAAIYGFRSTDESKPKRKEKRKNHE
jgi:hypothetical protein